MVNSLFSEAVLIDASAAIALADPKDQFHKEATVFFNQTDAVWVILNITSHEVYKRIRYKLGFQKAILAYNSLMGDEKVILPFKKEDELEAVKILTKFSEHKLSFHDALCIAIMKKTGIYRAFAFDKHFFLSGYEIYPGNYR